MELIIIAVAAVVAIVAVAAVSQRIAVAAPLSMVVVGIALSFLPGLPKIEVDPEWILAGALPPLLYATAVHVPAHDFRRDFKAIVGLAVPLVVLTTVCCGLLFQALLPGLGLAFAFALGAVVSPTDAVAATSVGRRLGLPSRLLTIVEGEGLVNDASSLVLLGSAVAAATGTVHLWKVGLDFVYAVAVAIVVGLVVGYANIRIRPRLKDPVLSTAASFAIPFLAWLPAEELGASGVLAVVVAGLVTGHLSPGALPARDRLAETVNWETVAFLLESGIFLLMGLELKTLLDDDAAAGLSVGQAVWIGLAAAALTLALRMVFIGPLVAVLRRDADRAAAARPELEKMHSRVTDPEVRHRFSASRLERLASRLARAMGDVDFLVSESFGWRGGVVLAWSGMRGVITVAAAQSLPDDTPFRPQVVLIAFVVAGTTLLAQGLTLPRVIRALKIPGDDPAADRAEYADLLADLAAQGEEVLDDPGLARPDGRPYDGDVLDRVREAALARASFAEATEPDTVSPRDQYRYLMLRILAAERAELLVARSAGRYRSRTLTRAQRALDLMEATLQQLPDLTDPESLRQPGRAAQQVLPARLDLAVGPDVGALGHGVMLTAPAPQRARRHRGQLGPAGPVEQHGGHDRGRRIVADGDDTVLRHQAGPRLAQDVGQRGTEAARLDQAAGQHEARDVREAEQRSRVVERAQRHLERGELVGRRRVRVHDRTHVRPRRHDLGVDRILDVPRPRAIKHRTVRVDQGDPAGVDFLEPPPGALHPGAPAVGIADAGVPPHHVALPGRRQRAGGLDGQQDGTAGVRGLIAHGSLIPGRPQGLTLGSWEAEVDILIVGGGIGGLTAALALARDGYQVRVLEKAAQFAELGAGLQLAPNATRILSRLGVLDRVLDAGVRPRRLLLRSAVTADELTALDLGEPFAARYQAPYVVMHRSDLLAILYEACQAAGVELCPDSDVRAVTDGADAATAECADGTRHDGTAVIAADGLHSVVRLRFTADQPVCSGFVAYRGTARIDQVTARSGLDEVVAWIGPDLHFVQYPLRAGQIYNQVAVFRSPKYAACPGLADGQWGGPDELDEAFKACCSRVREATGFLWRDRWWPMYDREPLAVWTGGRIALLGDAAHPMLQYLAQGACQAIEDADALARALAACPGRALIGQALAHYAATRAPHAARVQRTARTWGDIWHVSGVGALLRDELFRRRPADDYRYTDWLYGPVRPSAL